MHVHSYSYCDSFESHTPKNTCYDAEVTHLQGRVTNTEEINENSPMAASPIHLKSIRSSGPLSPPVSAAVRPQAAPSKAVFDAAALREA